MERRIEGKFFVVTFPYRRFYMRGPNEQGKPLGELVSASVRELRANHENGAITELTVALRFPWTIYERVEQLGLFGLRAGNKSHPVSASDLDYTQPVDMTAEATQELLDACSDLAFGGDGDDTAIEQLVKRVFDGDADKNVFKRTENYRFRSVRQTTADGRELGFNAAGA